MALKYSARLFPAFLALHLILSCTQQHASASDGTSLAASSRKQVHEEEDEIGYIQSLIVNTPAVASVESSYQQIEVYDSDHFGKVFVLDDCLQLTERDAPHYNEMLAHVPVMEYLGRRSSSSSDTNDENLKVLVVGGGDGYVVSELLKHSQIDSIDHIELDEEVINVSKEHLPWGDAWKDEKVNLIIGDGAAYVKQQADKGESYHVIVQDASDPFWLDEDGGITTLPSSVLYDTSHFESLYKLLRPKEGVLMFQAETYNIPSNLKSIRKWRGLLRDIGFGKPRYGSISISTYPTGQIGFFAAHARDDDVGGERVCEAGDTCDGGDGVVVEEMEILPELDWNRILAQFHGLSGKTRYYHPRIHRSAYDLPLWVEQYVNGDGVDI
mmetsp:Transcript_7723/g.13994  ORF Transcript_7723/g.13994 Transcript_7723/m.13994 type:complete len:383 (+) Transcript_7723:42-1190(+)|eukprot:CAMPEP_0201632300 /NCGR_PEP_ID=MMETSP0493-20130528/5984_1 /ASSEMBLY_ACC=CAM_ASM_000838 /TAXON_ID=420259 /ORGANISM="Thalassiosira gravida, Strain GMp14c1" /LENGTH=382 /DNA_ID=CAMNT_0048103803 /DNA_START=8 /DNA_END=1156 /DNA_ORIENTATION=+